MPVIYFGMKKTNAKILIFDIETMASVAWTWAENMYETGLVEIIKPGLVIGYSAEWFETGEIKTRMWSDYEGYKPYRNLGSYISSPPTDDKAIVKDIWELLNQASIIVVQNGQAFDLRYMNSRFVYYGLAPVNPYQIVDTKKAYKKYLRLPSYSLDNISEYYGLGHKKEHEGWPLWKKCILGDKTAIRKMKQYNRHDVVLTKEIYLKIRPFIKEHPNMNLIMGTELRCRNCGGKNLGKEGKRYTLAGAKQQFSCKDCGAWGTVPLDKDDIIKGKIR